MKRFTRLIWPLLFAGMVFGLYNLKAQVEEQEKELARIQRAIEDEREAIQVLRAEWSYLNHPERLRRLAAAKLELQPVAARQMASFERLAQRLAEAAPVETASREVAAPQLGFRSR
ncbi:MAG TPA: hypothetical protein VIF14_07565 [Alphaproteobacteria bacterium]|jgi:hypothetical protein